MIDKEMERKKLEKRIAEILSKYSQKTGEVVESIYLSPYEDRLSSDVYYDIDLELL
jgi:hypothetical protein